MDRRRIRFDRLVPARNLTKEDDRLPAGAAAAADAPAGSPAPLVRKRPRDMSPRDWAIYLLHSAAEVEHALMVQYLYALYSLNPAASGPAANDPGTTVQTSPWATAIRKIAVEEMGHLLTLQNVLRFIGGAMNFEREDFPLRSEVYPFPFELEPLTKDSLAKYVFAEMPEGGGLDGVISPTERQEIEDRAMRAAGVKKGAFLNHVGVLYATLLDVFRGPEFQDPATAGFPADTTRYQATAPDPWDRTEGNESIRPDPGGSPPDLKGPRVLTMSSVQEAIEALDFIARQGEASDSVAAADSHFGRFLKIYRQFPEPGAAGWPVPPAFPVSTNPTTTPRPVTPGTILHPVTQLWARLFDVRYRILLASLSHVTAVPNRETDATTEPTATARTLVTWVFEEMKDRTSLGIRDLARLLARMPSAESPDAPTAGAPFGMPYTLALPDRDPERWRHHLDLLDGSAALVATLQAIDPDPAHPVFGEAKAKLPALVTADDGRRQEIRGFLGLP